MLLFEKASLKGMREKKQNGERQLFVLLALFLVSTSVFSMLFKHYAFPSSRSNDVTNLSLIALGKLE